MIPSYPSRISTALFFKRVLPFQERKSNLLGAFDLLTLTSVPSSFRTTPSLLSVNTFLSSFKTRLQGNFPVSFCQLHTLILYTSCVCISMYVHKQTSTHVLLLPVLHSTTHATLWCLSTCFIQFSRI